MISMRKPHFHSAALSATHGAPMTHWAAVSLLASRKHSTGQFLFPAEVLVPGKVDSVPSIAFPGGLVWMQGRQEEGTASFQLERTATAITGPTLHQQWRWITNDVGNVNDCTTDNVPTFAKQLHVSFFWKPDLRQHAEQNGFLLKTF